MWLIQLRDERVSIFWASIRKTKMTIKFLLCQFPIFQLMHWTWQYLLFFYFCNWVRKNIFFTHFQKRSYYMELFIVIIVGIVVVLSCAIFWLTEINYLTQTNNIIMSYFLRNLKPTILTKKSLNLSHGPIRSISWHN